MNYFVTIAVCNDISKKRSHSKYVYYNLMTSIFKITGVDVGSESTVGKAFALHKARSNRCKLSGVAQTTKR